MNNTRSYAVLLAISLIYFASMIYWLAADDRKLPDMLFFCASVAGYSIAAWGAVKLIRQKVLAKKQDITAKRQTEERIKHMAYYDDLTGLPNRRLFRELLAEELASERADRIYTVLLNIDRFKFVNSSLGQDIGDILLLQLADRLLRVVGETGVAARMEGDEFALLISQGSGETYSPTEIAGSIFDQLEVPFIIQEYTFHVTVSVGIVECEGNRNWNESEVLKDAGIALSKAKEKGKNHYELYKPEMNESYVSKFTLESDLRKAIQEGQFFLVYQPQYSIATGELVGTEALIRWRHPEHGIIPPNEFIPIAEESGLIVPLSEWILFEACRQNKAWQDEGLPAIPVSVNLSMGQFLQPNLNDKVWQCLAETGLDPQFLELEITESMTMEVEFATKALLSLKRLGIQIAIDDFGTGYSSLNYLKNFPIDKLKIDQTFVHDILEDRKNAAIVRTIISIAHHLKQKVIAEGVEKEDQLLFLRQNGCDEIQGHFMSPPMSHQHIQGLLTEWKQVANASAV